MCVKKLTHFVKAKGSINNRMMCVNTLTHIVTRQRLHTHPEDVCQRCCAGFVLCYKLTAAHTLRPLLHERERPRPHTPSALCYTSTSWTKGVYVYALSGKDQGCLHLYQGCICVYTLCVFVYVYTSFIYVYMCIQPSYMHICVHILYICAHVYTREVGGWGRDPKKCTKSIWGMGSSTI